MNSSVTKYQVPGMSLLYEWFDYYRNQAWDGTHRRDGTRVRKKKQERIFNCIFAPPSARWHRVYLNDVNPRVSATAPGPRGDIRAPLLSRTITTGTCVVSTLFTRGNEWSCFLLIGMKIVRSQPSSQHTYGTCRLQLPRSQKELAWYYGTWCRRGRIRTTVGS